MMRSASYSAKPRVIPDATPTFVTHDRADFVAAPGDVAPALPVATTAHRITPSITRAERITTPELRSRPRVDNRIPGSVRCKVDVTTASAALPARREKTYPPSLL